MHYLVGIDNGGTFSKAALFDEDGVQLSSASLPTAVITPHPGFNERSMDELWDSTAAVIHKAIEKSGVNPADIAGVSLSGHGKGLYMVGKDGKPAYNGILSTDTRAWKQLEHWKETGVYEKVRPLSHQEILVMQPVSLLAWFKENEPAVLENVKYIFAVKDYIRYRLTDEAFAGDTDYSGANLVNLNTRAYDKNLLDCFGLGDLLSKLPPLRSAAEVCGHITVAAAEKTGLPVGTPVAAGMFDVDACGLASGLLHPEQLCMIAGTWAINEYIAKEPITNGTVDLNSMYCVPGYYLVEESSPTSAGNLEWFINSTMAFDRTAIEATGERFYDQLDRWVAEIPPEQSTVLFLPFLNGSNENPQAKGSFLGLTCFHDRRHMLRAIYEGVVFSHVTHVKKLLKNRTPPASIRLTGGAANSDLWVQIFADALQTPIDVIGKKELGAQGAAIAAGIAAGIYRDYEEAVGRIVKISKTIVPRPEYKAVYEDKYQLYRAVNDAMNPIWKEFDRIPGTR